MKTYRLAKAAEADIAALLDHTYDLFGEVARRRYETLLATALRDIAADIGRVGVKLRPELGEGVRSYHLRHSRNRAAVDGGVISRPRHLLLFRQIDVEIVGVGRVLHDSMEIERHLPDEYGEHL